ncbi:type II toxin-antitoxin system ParD family antitoxin [uncultured Halorubrum sp.]|jgi:Arc/MetJ-type ribon-helix-helix transcriptional regulator|uniref:ribbon-helix-helix domain-containing protein n=1 Tax=uncultured Halorubrum sp. TaxID=399555 RepID=UPI002625846A|nr:type II toxin-antitoxin system ParD family antitoxin [uncultured Halorubrum sp.]
MPKISVEIPAELLGDLDEHVGDDGKFVNRSDAVRASIRKTLDLLDEIDARHDRLDDDFPSTAAGSGGSESAEETDE